MEGKQNKILTPYDIVIKKINMSFELCRYQYFIMTVFILICS